MARGLALSLTLALAALAAWSATRAQRAPGAPSDRAAESVAAAPGEPGLRPEFCSLLVTGRPSTGRPYFPWHEALVSGFHRPSGDRSPAFVPGTGSGPAAEASSAEEPGRALLLAGRARDAWEALAELSPEPGSEVAFLRAWAAGASGAPTAADLLRAFAKPGVPLACRAPAALAAADALAGRGEVSSSLGLLVALERDLPQISDYVRLWSIEALARAAGAVETEDVEALYRELRGLRAPPFILRRAELARARAFARTGRPARARPLLAALIFQVPRRDRPGLLLELAELEARLGNGAAADGHLRAIAERHPGSEEAAALLEPTSGEGGRPRLRLSPETRAAILFAHGRTGEAVAALTPTSDPRLLRMRAEIRLRNGDYDEAAADYLEAIRRGGDPDELRMELAAAHARGGEPGRARAVYREIYDEQPDGTADPQVVYLIGDAFQDESVRAPGLADSAAAWFRLLVERHPRSRLAPRGLLRVAHLRFGRADWTAAGELYREYLRRYPAAEDVREARYWFARAVEESGRPGEARALYGALLRPAIDDYYALLARRRLGGARTAAVDVIGDSDPSESTAVAADWPSGDAAAPTVAAETFLPVESSPADTLLPADSPGTRALGRARGLLLVGEMEAAQLEIDEAVRLSGGSSEELRRVARWALAVGYPESAFRIGVALISGGSAGPRVARLAFPQAFGDYVLLEARETELPAGLLWAVMREESRFDPAARSPAGALGLLQLMPATARREADRAVIESFEIGDLERAEANLHLGALHLRHLLDFFSGDSVAALAAYNAGREAASRWRGFPEASTPESYVERIPFRETRNYVKQVIAARARYEELYVAR